MSTQYICDTNTIFLRENPVSFQPFFLRAELASPIISSARPKVCGEFVVWGVGYGVERLSGGAAGAGGDGSGGELDPGDAGGVAESGDCFAAGVRGIVHRFGRSAHGLTWIMTSVPSAPSNPFGVPLRMLSALHRYNNPTLDMHKHDSLIL